MQEEELINKFGIDIEALKREQIKLSKNISLKDEISLEDINRIAAVESICVRNKIISAILVCDKEFNILEQQYFIDKLRFPYIYGLRAYREMPSMIEAFNKLTEKPDVVLLDGHGINHARLGLASHFSLVTGIPAIGIAESLFEGNVLEENSDIIMNDKKVGKALQSKENSRSIFVSPGNKISIKNSYELVKNLIKPPHKLPEPLHMAYKYVKEVRKELAL